MHAPFFPPHWRVDLFYIFSGETILPTKGCVQSIKTSLKAADTVNCAGYRITAQPAREQEGEEMCC